MKNQLIIISKLFNLNPPNLSHMRVKCDGTNFNLLGGKLKLRVGPLVGIS